MLEKFPTSAGYRAGILFIYVCFVAIYWVTPLYGDDLCFIKDYAAHTGSNELTIRGICDFFVYNWHTENGRIPNLLFVTPFVMAFGRHAGAFILAIFATGMVAETALLSARIVGRPRVAGSHLAFVWAVSTATLSWYNNCFLASHALNYVLPTWMMLWLVRLVILTSEHKISGWQLALTAFFALLCGWMHEGCSAMLLGGLGLWIISRKFRMPASTWIVVAMVAVGFALTMSSPMIWMRVSLENHAVADVAVATPPMPTIPLTANPAPVYTRIWNLLWRVMPLLIILGVTAGVSLCFTRGREALTELWQRQYMRIAAFSVVTGIAMWTVLARHNAGVTWFPQAMGLVLFSALAFKFVDGRIPAKALKWATGLTFAAIGAVFVSATAWTSSKNKEFQEIMAEAQASPNGTVFRDLLPRPHAPTLRLLPEEAWRSNMHLFAINSHENKVINVVPAALRDFSAAKGRRINGNAHLMEYKGALIAPYSPLEYDRIDLPCEVPTDYYDYVLAVDGEEGGFPRLTTRYVFTAADGTRWLYLEPVFGLDSSRITGADISATNS